jgi:predicted kinase
MMKATRLTDDVSVLKQSLLKLPEPVASPALIVVSGLPGTGKSHFCRKLAERIDLVILESDGLRKLLFPTPAYSKEESTQLFRACHGLIEELLGKGISVALDATNLEEHNREQLYHIADQSGARMVIVRMEAPPNGTASPEGRARAWISQTTRGGWNVYSKMSTVEDKPQSLAVDSSKDIAPVIDKIVRLVNR